MENNGDTFDISLRVLGNELIGFTMTVNDFKTKWVLVGTITIVLLSASVSTFGPQILDMFVGD